MSLLDNIKPMPLNSSQDYNHRKIKDDRYYELLTNNWITKHKCSFSMSALSTGRHRLESADLCDRNVTYKIAPTKGTDWNHWTFNNRYKDGAVPTIETKTFPLWSALYNQYKIDEYEMKCKGTQEYKQLLDEINMRDLNDQLLVMAMRLINTYDSCFCAPCGVDYGTETSPLLFEAGKSDASDWLFSRGDSFKTSCLPSGFTAIFPMCAKSIFLKDAAINDLYSNCCKDVPPSLSGVMPDWINDINGVTAIFIRDEFFEKVEVGDHIAYKIPVYHTDAFVYHPAMLDTKTIGADKEEDGLHHRKVFFYSMNVVDEVLIDNDWIAFDKGQLNKVVVTP